MPSLENCEIKLSPTPNVDYLQSHYGMDDLITEIKDNLRLKSHKPSHLSQKRRSSPYTLPSRNGCECCLQSSSKCVHAYNTKAQKDNQQDPFQVLQELLRSQSLVKEAVRRLELGLSPKTRIFYDDSEDDCHTS